MEHDEAEQTHAAGSARDRSRHVRSGRDVEALAERLIGFLDATAGDPDLEEENEHGDGGADGEPTLGASDAMNQKRAWWAKSRRDREEQNEDGDEPNELEVDEVELRGEADGDNGGCVDDEPSLGSFVSRVFRRSFHLLCRRYFWRFRRYGPRTSV
jgi:hypothetical protein